MSSETEKPFVCTFPSCSQTFTNHDHLLAHAQRHEFSLKFRAGENLLIDQTPTPTRFLRNCEENGLFQELETNPFDQDFKSATGPDAKEDGAKTSDDASANDSSSEITQAPAATITTITVPTTIPVAPPPNLANPDRPVPMATAPAHISTATALTKQKLLQNIQLKEQQKLLELHVVQQLQSSPEILVQALKNITPVSDGEITLESSQGTEVVTFLTPSVTPEQVRRKRGRRPDDESPELKRQRFLERNRAAASRCRAKKKQWVDSLEHKSKDLESNNNGLLTEVVMLRSEVQQLKSILIAHKDCPLIVHQTIITTTPKSSSEGGEQAAAGVTLLSQLASMPSMSPLISSPVPSVGSVVPSITPSHTNTSTVTLSPPTTTIVITTNGLTQQTPEVGKDVEISADQ